MASNALPDRAAPLPFAAPVARSVSLTRLVSEIARAVAEIGKITVEGEVHRPTNSAAGRTYFTLKDRGSQISVTVPASRQRFCRVKDGERVALTGIVEMQAAMGRLQMVAQEIVPVGEGAISAMIAESRARLEAEGILQRPRRTLPILPLCIGVLCGTEAAVRKDIESVVAARFPGYPVRFLEVTVSGGGAVDSLLAGLSVLQADRSIEVIVMARGGGDATQLLPFSDESLCRAVAAARVPIVSAIGHDGDRPLSDDVADLRAGTPSIAASLVVPDKQALVSRINGYSSRVDVAAQRSLEKGATRLRSVPWETALDRRFERSAERLQRIDWSRAITRSHERAAVRLASVNYEAPLVRRVTMAQLQLQSLSDRVQALSPERVLERGYAVVRLPSGEVVRNPDQVAPDAQLSVQVASGSFAVVRSDGSQAGPLGRTDAKPRQTGAKTWAEPSPELFPESQLQQAPAPSGSNHEGHPRTSAEKDA